MFPHISDLRTLKNEDFRLNPFRKQFYLLVVIFSPLCLTLGCCYSGLICFPVSLLSPLICLWTCPVCCECPCVLLPTYRRAFGGHFTVSLQRGFSSGPHYYPANSRDSKCSINKQIDKNTQTKENPVWVTGGKFHPDATLERNCLKFSDLLSFTEIFCSFYSWWSQFEILKNHTW